MFFLSLFFLPDISYLHAPTFESPNFPQLGFRQKSLQRFGSQHCFLLPQENYLQVIETPLPDLVNEWMIEWRERNKDQHSWLRKSILKCSIQTEARFSHRNTSAELVYPIAIPHLFLNWNSTHKQSKCYQLQSCNSTNLLCCLCHHCAFLIYFTFSL